MEYKQYNNGVMIPFVKNPAHNPSNDKVPFLLPDDATLKNLTNHQLLEIYWRYINTLQVLCRNQTRLGSIKDGGKEICEDEKFKPREPCLVYSFGSNFQFDFEIDAANRYRCEVHTFDPSKPVTNRNRIPSGVKFHLIGLSGRTMINKNGWQMETLSSIRKQLNHTKRVVDVLKMDIEGGEWTTFPEMLQSGVLKYVKQICLEVHFKEKRPDARYHLSILRMLYEHGFYIFMRDHNIVSVRRLNPHQEMTFLNEISLINVNI